MDLVAQTLKDEGGRVLATLIRLTRDIGHAEDALQEASIAALQTWPTEGIPQKPGAWLLTVARRKALDRIRRETARTSKETEAMRLLASGPDDSDELERDELRLLFTCCHPALSEEAKVALALRTLSGLTTPEIARAFLVNETTMGQRISRAKKKIRVAQIPYRVPEDHELPDRLAPVLATIYLVFTTGHSPPTTPLDSRTDLINEAIHLGRRLVHLMPDEPECAGLLALMLSTAARQPGRIDANGNFVLMRHQDRSAWDEQMAHEADEILSRVLPLQRVGAYQLQASISSLHTLAPTFADTDWTEIAQLYRGLFELHPTPVVAVNHAVAESMVSGPNRGLELLDHVSGVERWHLYWSTRANFLERLGDVSGAEAAYVQALDCQPNASDTAFLEAKLRQLSASSAS